MKIQYYQNELDLSRATAITITPWMVVFSVDKTKWTIHRNYINADALQFLKDRENELRHKRR